MEEKNNEKRKPEKDNAKNATNDSCSKEKLEVLESGALKHDVECSDNETVESKTSAKKKAGLGKSKSRKPCPEENNEEKTDTTGNAPTSEDTSKLQMIKLKVEDGLGFELEDLLSWEKFVKMLHRPMDPSSLALSRILFGFLMVLDIPDERGLGEADLRWGDPDECRFPLFNFLGPLPLHWMCITYLIMWIGAAGITLGAYFKLSCIMFILPYWYIFLLDKTAWNNHSYLYGILAFIFLITDSHYTWSIDAWRGKIEMGTDIPLWNYALIRFQQFLLYFYAGLKKTEFDWLSGHSMSTLSNHWVFEPWKLFFTTEQIDLWVVHVFGFFLDLTAGFWLYFDSTRPASFIFLTCFHLMNSQLFYIGMFPFVCLATMHLFCYPDWPKKLLQKFEKLKHLVDEKTYRNPDCVYKKNVSESDGGITRKQSYCIILILVHAALQMFLPYSHFITKGYNNWTNGLYGYSWDMMVHTWDTSLITVKVVNLKTNETIFLDPEAWVRNNKWQRHADMVIQYSKCVERNLEKMDKMKNISIYLDAWVSLNKRFHQRMFNPHVDLLKASWSPFKKVTWLMPLLTEFTHWRTGLYELEKEIHSWSKSSDVLFMADFPGFSVQNYIHEDITNVTVNVLEGKVTIEIENEEPIDLSAGTSTSLPSAAFHEIFTVSDSPSAFMYTFNNKTRLLEPNIVDEHAQTPFLELLHSKIDNYLNSIALVSNAFLRVVYSVPMVRRVRIQEEGK